MRKVIVLLFFLLIPLNVEATIKYRWYQEEKIYSENYYIEGENDINFPYKSDISINETSDWLEEEPEIKPNRVMEVKTELINKDKIRYIRLTNVNIEELRFRIVSIEVYINGTKIPIKMSANNFADKIYSNIPGYDDNDIARILFQYQLKFILIDLQDLYDYRNINLKLSFSNVDNIHYYFEIIANDNGQKNYLLFTKIIDDNFNGNQEYYLNLDQDFEEHIYYQDYYQFMDIKYKYYKIERIYLDGYYDNMGPGYIKDETDYIEVIEDNKEDNDYEDIVIPINDNSITENISYDYEKRLSENNQISTIAESIDKQVQILKTEDEIINSELIKEENSPNEKKTSNKINLNMIYKKIIIIMIPLTIYFLIKFVERKNNKVLSNQYKNK